MKENERIFKSYLRGLLSDLQDAREAMEEDNEKAKRILDRLIDDARSGLEN